MILPSFGINTVAIKLHQLFRLSAKQESCLESKLQARKERRKPEERPRWPAATPKRGERAGKKPTPSTSTRCWNRCIPTLESPARPWASWILSSTTSSRGSQLKLHALLTTTRSPPSPAGKSRPLWDFSFLESLPNMQCLRAPRLSPSTPAASKLLSLCTLQTAFIKATTF